MKTDTQDTLTRAADEYAQVAAAFETMADLIRQVEDYVRRGELAAARHLDAGIERLRGAAARALVQALALVKVVESKDPELWREQNTKLHLLIVEDLPLDKLEAFGMVHQLSCTHRGGCPVVGAIYQRLSRR